MTFRQVLASRPEARAGVQHDVLIDIAAELRDGHGADFAGRRILVHDGDYMAEEDRVEA